MVATNRLVAEEGSYLTFEDDMIPLAYTLVGIGGECGS
jgi:hypothetical protein